MPDHGVACVMVLVAIAAVAMAAPVPRGVFEAGGHSEGRRDLLKAEGDVAVGEVKGPHESL